MRPGAYKLLYSSDAHCLENIAEREYFLNVPDPTREGLFDYLCACRARVWGDNICRYTNVIVGAI